MAPGAMRWVLRAAAASLARAAGVGAAVVGAGVGAGVVGAGVVGAGVGAQPPATCLTPHDVDAHWLPSNALQPSQPPYSVTSTTPSSTHQPRS